MIVRWFILCISILLLSPIAHAAINTVVFDSTVVTIDPAEKISYIEDTDHLMSVDDAIGLQDDQWSALPDNVANFGFSSSVYWFTFNVTNSGSYNVDLYTHLDYALLDKITFYTIHNKQVEQQYYTGDLLPFKNRPIDYHTFLFPLSLEADQTKRVILRIETSGSVQVPISIAQKDSFWIDAQALLFLYGSFISIILIMSAYNFCLFIILKDWSYLTYCLFTLSIVGIHSSLDGFAYQWFWPNAPQWHQVSTITLIALGLISTTLFTKTLLPIPKTGWISNTLKTLVVIAVISAVTTIFIPYRPAAMLNGLITLIIMGGVFVVGIAMLKHSPRIARFYTAAWSAYFIGIVLKAASKVGIIPYSDFAEYAGNIGAVSGVVILSLALADRINTERRAKEKAQHQSINNLQRFQSLYENALEGIFSFDLKGNLLNANPAFLTLVGIENLNTFNGDYSQLRGYSLSYKDFQELLKAVKKTGQVVDYEVRMFNKDDVPLWVNISARLKKDENNDLDYIEGTLININDRKVFEGQLKHLAEHDSLTGFFNRRAFETHAREKLESVRNYQESCCLLYMDLDQFKIVNDLCGHTAGDVLLKNLSQRLLKKVEGLGKGQIIARLGGDEFGVLLSHTHLEKARLIAEEFRLLIENFLFVWEGRRYTLGVSIGLVEFRPYHQSIEQVLVMADTACYMAKDQGRNRVHTFFESDKDLQFRQLEMQWVSSIKEAIAKNQFFLVFQHIASNQKVDEGYHYEILLRLINENGNLCAPSQFLPAAERYNLMPNIDRWVIRHYFSWLNENPDHLKQLSCASLNLSTQSLGDEIFSDFLVNIFDEYNIPPQKICFEITEGMAITHLDNTQSFIRKFGSLGCRFALDDFGTGFSSYAYLKELKVDYLKIDGVFVKNITEDSVDLAMVKSISDVAQAIGIETIAEFVESEEIRQTLIDIGIDYSQGYHIHKPVSLDSKAFVIDSQHST